MTTRLREIDKIEYTWMYKMRACPVSAGKKLQGVYDVEQWYVEEIKEGLHQLKSQYNTTTKLWLVQAWKQMEEEHISWMLQTHTS